MNRAFCLGVALAALLWAALGLGTAAWPMHAGVAPQLKRGMSLVQDEAGHPEPCRSLAAIFALHGPDRVRAAFQMHPPENFTGPVLLVVLADHSSRLHPRDPAGCYLGQGAPYLTIDWLHPGP